MREPAIIAWVVLIIILSFVLKFVLKAKGRKMGKYIVYHQLILVLFSFGMGWVIYYFLNPSIHLVWVNHLFFFGLGILNCWVMYKRPWSERSKISYDEDSFAIEFIFTIMSSLFAAIAYVSSPQLFRIIDFQTDLSNSVLGVPFLFLLPFLYVKIVDYAGHIPFRALENPWLFPIEPEKPDSWPWRDLIQVNFQVKKNMIAEYNLFSWAAKPWIEAPKEVALGKVFRLTIQERRKVNKLSSIQDMGDEYAGEAKFCWLFSVKRLWYKPSTWFRNPRYLNPDLTIAKNELRKGDVILAKRIPGNGQKNAALNYDGFEEDDSEKTIIIYK